MKRRVLLNLNEEDCQWLEQTYGEDWKKRVEQHIENEIRLRRTDTKPLSMRKPWNY
jgi:transcriptional accessory protein Tex/SPT6